MCAQTNTEHLRVRRILLSLHLNCDDRYDADARKPIENIRGHDIITAHRVNTGLSIPLLIEIG